MERSELKLLLAGILVGTAAGFLLARNVYMKGAPAAGAAAGPVVMGPAAPGGQGMPPAGAGAPPQGGPDAEALHQEINALVAKAAADPSDRATRVALGNITFDNGLFDMAAKFYEEALKLDGKDPAVITDLGVAYRNLGQAQKAVEHFEKAVALQPDHAKGWFNIAVVKIADLKDAPGARAAMDKVLALDPNLPGARELDGKIREAGGV